MHSLHIHRATIVGRGMTVMALNNTTLYSFLFAFQPDPTVTYCLYYATGPLIIVWTPKMTTITSTAATRIPINSRSLY